MANRYRATIKFNEKVSKALEERSRKVDIPKTNIIRRATAKELGVLK